MGYLTEGETALLEYTCPLFCYVQGLAQLTLDIDLQNKHQELDVLPRMYRFNTSLVLRPVFQVFMSRN